MSKLRVSEEFSRYLGGRYRDDGPWSGEQFRDDVLIPAVRRAVAAHQQLEVVLDGVVGVPSSFSVSFYGTPMVARATA